MTNHPFTPDDHEEPLDEGGTWLLDLVSAVDHLRRGYRPGFTVWDALAEALSSNDWPAAAGIAETIPPDRHTETQRAVRRWVTVMAERYNAGRHWPHPAPRRLFPAPLIRTPEV